MTSRRTGRDIKAILLVVALTGALLAVAGPAHAATFTVDSTSDAPDAVPGDGNCATAGAACTLRAAVQEAGAGINGVLTHTIIVPAGVYVLSVGGADEDQAATGDLDLTYNTITIDGAGMDAAIVRCDPEFDDRAFQATTGIHAIEGLAVEDCESDFGDEGAGIDNSTNLTLDGVRVSGNTTVPNCSIEAASQQSRQFFFCWGGWGGGVSNDGTLTIFDSSFEDNTAVATFGGGGAIVNFGSLTVDGSFFGGNMVDGPAGGGAISNYADLAVANSTFWGNGAVDGVGGAIYQGTSEGSVSTTLIGATLAGNEAGSGGGIYSDSFDFIVAGSIVANNTPDNCSGGEGGAAITSDGNNMQFPGTDCPFDQPSDRVADPLIEPPADNGGPTLTMALPQGSPAIDTATDCSGLAEDQRGVVRPQDGDGNGSAACDIGAFEREAPEPPPPPEGGGGPPQPGPPPACSDGVDNDNDGLRDFPADPQCSSAADPSESVVETSPSPSPSVSPTASPEPTPSVTPSPSSTPSESPSPSASPSPTPTPTPTPTPGSFTVDTDLSMVFDEDGIKGKVKADGDDVSGGGGSFDAPAAAEIHTEPTSDPEEIADSCLAHRLVIVFKAIPGDDNKEIGVTRSNKRGRWNIKKKRVAQARYYAVVKQSSYTMDDGTDVTCERDRTRRLRPPRQ